MHIAQRMHSSTLPSTTSSVPSLLAKMSTGQTSSSFAASSASPVTASSTSMPMKTASLRIGGRSQFRLHDLRDLRDLLGDGDARLRQPLDLLGGGVLLALHDRAGVAEAHARHLVHEPPGHERDDRQP